MSPNLERWFVRIGLLAIVIAHAARPSPAQACSPGPPITTAALPGWGTTNVSTATSLTVSSVGVPWGLSLLADGQNVPLSAPLSLGSASYGASVWQVRAATPGSMLVGGAEHVLSQTMGDGSTLEVTRFTTAAGYDKAEGVAPVLRAVHLWRVRYPVADIGSGNCVFAEYHGFITVDYDAATVPNTAPLSVVHTFHLAPKNGGSEQRFVFTGETPFAGREPEGAYPLPIGIWQPELDPTRQYCLSISAFGDGDLARLPVGSESVCADVVQLSAAGAPPPPQIGGSPMNGGGGGCAVGADRGARGSALAALLAIAAAIGATRRRRR